MSGYFTNRVWCVVRPRDTTSISKSKSPIGETLEQSDATYESRSRSERNKNIAWFDYAKGICIAFVVMMHSTLGVEKLYGSEGFMHYVVAFAQPFRMPDFFFLSALFLPLAMPRSWAHYLDKKVVHFAWFYAIWAVILIAFKALGKHQFTTGHIGSELYEAIINPYPALWFIYVLPLFFVVTKLLRSLPGWALFSFAVMLQLAVIHTGWQAIDEFAVHYYVFFVAGYLASPHVFKLAERARNNIPLALSIITAWAIINGVLAFSPSPFEGWPTFASLPLISIALGLFGALSIVLVSVLISEFAHQFSIAKFIRFCGQNSIVLYLSFTIPMAITRLVLAKLNIIQDIGLVSLIVWLTALTTPLLVFAVLRHTPLNFLYQRPKRAALPYQVQTKEAKPGLRQGASSPTAQGTLYRSIVKSPAL